MNTSLSIPTALFIAGTDTGVGKTHAACALLYALRAAGIHAAGMKPVASGCVSTAAGLRSQDALALQAASNEPRPPYEQINPVALREPCSPHLAAALEQRVIALADLAPAYKALRCAYQTVVVEGVGGWLVPLAPGLFAADIARDWRLPVILVVGMRLGCLSHALLTLRAMAGDGCTLLAWIANQIDPAMAAPAGNLATLRALLPAPCLGVLPYGVSMQRAGEYLDLSLLINKTARVNIPAFS